jgi:hypothetical protein
MGAMSILQQIDAALKGKKTYIVMLAGILAAVAAYVTGEATLVQAGQMLLIALGLGGLRSGVANKTP